MSCWRLPKELGLPVVLHCVGWTTWRTNLYCRQTHYFCGWANQESIQLLISILTQASTAIDSPYTLASSDIRITVYISGFLPFLHESVVESEQLTTVEVWQVSKRQWMWWDWIQHQQRQLSLVWLRTKLTHQRPQYRCSHLLPSFFLYSAILRDILGFIPDTHTRHANQHKMFVSTVSFFKNDC